ncbi:MAG: hypothetical protein ACYCYE_18290, partial [Clostridia bacterium]
MSPKINEKIDVLPDGTIEPITDFELVMAKIEHDAHKGFNGVEKGALKNKNVKKQGANEVKP